MLVVEAALTTYIVSLGFGKHIWDFPVQNFPKFIVPAMAKATFAVTAEAWSKTSFAVTLLRISDGWTKKFVWFVIITVNLFMGLSSMVFYLQCTPINALWDQTVPGTCWAHNTTLIINIVASGKSRTNRHKTCHVD